MSCHIERGSVSGSYRFYFPLEIESDGGAMMTISDEICVEGYVVFDDDGFFAKDLTIIDGDNRKAIVTDGSWLSVTVTASIARALSELQADDLIVSDFYPSIKSSGYFESVGA